MRKGCSGDSFRWASILFLSFGRGPHFDRYNSDLLLFSSNFINSLPFVCRSWAGEMGGEM